MHTSWIESTSFRSNVQSTNDRLHGAVSDRRVSRNSSARRGSSCARRPRSVSSVALIARSTLRIVAEHADIWNIIGPLRNSVEDLIRRSGALDEQCSAIGRDPREITRSVQMPVSFQDLTATRETLLQLLDAGFSYLVLNPAAPYPGNVARRLTEEIILPVPRR